MKALGYIRVSGKGQVEKGGEERQHEAIKEFCLRNNLDFCGHSFEAGVSGTVEGVDRPVFSSMLEEIESEPGQCIVVERMDRLARDLMVQEFLLRECRERNIQVYAADQGVLIDMASDGGDPTRKLIRQFLGALAEWEKSALVMKLRKGRERKKLATGRCEGAVRYGATAPEQFVITLITDARKEGVSWWQIAKELNASGYRTRTGKEWNKWSVKSAIGKET